MDFDFKLAQAKLQKEQNERKERARRILKKEKAAREEAERRQEALEAHQQAKRLEAQRLALQKQEEEEADLIAGEGVRFNVVLQAESFEGPGDKIKLPTSSFDALEGQHALEKGPMFFELTANNENETKTHCGVLEFTAPEGVALIPTLLFKKLFSENPSDSSLVRVRYVRLPKGTYAKLQPETMGFSYIPNHRAVLETALRQFATLSESDLLTVNHGGAEYKLRVLELKPSNAISVLETDVEVDIMEPSPESSNDKFLYHLVPGKSEIGTVLEGQFKYYKFGIDHSLLNMDVNVAVRLDIDEQNNIQGAGDADIYVSRHPLLYPSQDNHHWSCHDLGSKSVIFRRQANESTDFSLYSVGVFGFRGTTTFKISVEFQRLEEAAASSSGQHLKTNAGMDSVGDSVQCENCRMFVPVRTVSLHQAFCVRHNVVCKYEGCGVVLRKEEAGKHLHCPKCAKVFQPHEMDKHVKVFHEPLACQCGALLEKQEMVNHKEAECPLRAISCRFCGDMVQAGGAAYDARDRIRGLSQHESHCGCRTAPCDSCGRAIMLKEMDLHITAVHVIGESTRVDTLPGNPVPSNPSFESQVGQAEQSSGFMRLPNFESQASERIENSAASGAALSQKAMLVSCPICGVQMHSERDVSNHIDSKHL